MWKGTAEILKARPAVTKTMPIRAPSDSPSPAADWAVKSSAKVVKEVVPVKP